METVTGEEYRENDEGTDSEEEDADTGEVEAEVTESEEEGGDEGEGAEGEPGEREEDGEEIGGDARPDQSDPGDERADDPQGENSAASRPSTAHSRLSRSPPRSRSASPDTLAKMTAALKLRTVDVRDRVASDLAKRQRQQKKYHGKRGAQRVGRPQGSKGKQDERVKLDRGGIWD